jgi:hypothetical protein
MDNLMNFIKLFPSAMSDISLKVETLKDKLTDDEKNELDSKMKDLNGNMQKASENFMSAISELNKVKM